MQKAKEESKNKSAFKEGMTLSEYLGEMKTGNFEQEEVPQQNLYETSKKVQNSPNKRIITYEIKQTDEDNYEESVDQQNKLFQESNTSIPPFNLQKKRSNVRINFPKNQPIYQESLSNSRGFRVRIQSNSPYKVLKKDPSSLTPNKNLAKTLSNNEWKLSDLAKLGSSTLYGKFLKGLKEKKNEKYFRKKNTRDMENVMKYEENVNEKYSKHNIREIRIDGVTDRLYERKIHHKIK